MISSGAGALTARILARTSALTCHARARQQAGFYRAGSDHRHGEKGRGRAVDGGLWREPRSKHHGCFGARPWQSRHEAIGATVRGPTASPAARLAIHALIDRRTRLSPSTLAERGGTIFDPGESFFSPRGSPTGGHDRGKCGWIGRIPGPTSVSLWFAALIHCRRSGTSSAAGLIWVDG